LWPARLRSSPVFRGCGNLIIPPQSIPPASGDHMLPEMIAKLKSPGNAGRRKPLRVEAPAGDPTCATQFGGWPQFFTAMEGGAQTRVLRSPTLRHSAPRVQRAADRVRASPVSRNRFFSSVRSWQRRSRPRMAGGQEAREVGRSEERGIAVPAARSTSRNHVSTSHIILAIMRIGD
jgi:hypothetical protein